MNDYRFLEMRVKDEKKLMTQEELAEKIGIPRNRIQALEKSPKAIPNNTELAAYCRYFGTTSDYLLGISTANTTDKSIKDICEYTGLSVKAIGTLNKISRNEPDSYLETHERTLFILNKLLSKIDNTNIFELMYHYLFGNYEELGHYNEYGQTVYDGNRVFASDKYLSQQLEIDSKYVSGALLNMIMEQLIFWKSEIEKNPNKDMILPSKKDLLDNIQAELDKIEELKKRKKELKRILSERLEKNPFNIDDIIECAANVRSFDGAMEMSQNRINEYKYTLKELFNYNYDAKKATDTNQSKQKPTVKEGDAPKQ